MEVELIGVGGLAGAGFVLAFVEMLRRIIGTDIIKGRFTPGLAVLIGIGVNVLIKLDAVPTEETTWPGTVLLGIMTGLTASGIYSSGKSLAGR